MLHQRRTWSDGRTLQKPGRCGVLGEVLLRWGDPVESTSSRVTMAITNGTFLKHPTLGLCKVTRVEPGKIHVVTETNENKTLLSAYVQKACARVPPADIDPESPLVAAKPSAASAKPRRRSGSIGSGRSRPCSHCGRPLNRSYYTPDRRLKSCPNCSTDTGSTQHVFYDHPRAFGTTDARSNDKTPDGVQSYCLECRERGHVTGRVLCDAADQ